MVRKHIHKYRRAKLGDSVIYKCIFGGCTHFINKALIEGRVCVCHRCNQPFIITKLTLRNCPAKPHCDNCYPKKDTEINLDSVLDELIK